MQLLVKYHVSHIIFQFKMRGTTRKRLSLNQWKTFSKNNILFHTLWHTYEARRLRNEIAYQGFLYNSHEFYWHAFVTRNVPHFKYPYDTPISADDGHHHRRFRSTADVAKGRYRVDSNHPNLLHSISYPLYEIDKELSGCKHRFDDSFRNEPKNITTFLQPYSYKFYAHQANHPVLTANRQSNTVHRIDTPSHTVNAYSRYSTYPYLQDHRSIVQSSTVQSHPYADVFSASNGMDLHITNAEADLVHRSVPYELRQQIFKPAVNNIIMQIQLLTIQRKSTAALNECLHSAYERNINAMVRYAACDGWAARQYAHTNMHTTLDIPSAMLYNENSSFLDLHHSLPVSSEIFYQNPTISHIKRKKFLIRSLINNPLSTLRCAYCSQTLSCSQCLKCEQCDFHFFNCRHMTNLNLLKKEKNMPMKLQDLAAVVCRRKVSVEAEKCFPNRDDIKKSSIAQCPIYQNNEVTFLPTPQTVVNYVEFFTFQQPEWPELLVRFRLETNIEKVEQRGRLQKMLSQPRFSMLYETNCPIQQKSQIHLQERSAYLNVPMNIRVMATQWNIHHSTSGGISKAAVGMFMDGMTRSEGRNSNLVPSWVYSEKPIPGFYHVEQIVGRFERKLHSVIERYETRDQWFDHYGRHYNTDFSTPQLAQNEDGDWVQITPPALLSSIQPTICVNPSTSSRVASNITYLNDRDSDTPSPSFFDDTLPSRDSIPSLEHSCNSMPSLEITPPPALVTLLSPQNDSQIPMANDDNDDNDDQNSLSDISDSVFCDDDDDGYTRMD